MKFKHFFSSRDTLLSVIEQTMAQIRRGELLSSRGRKLGTRDYYEYKSAHNWVSSVLRHTKLSPYILEVDDNWLERYIRHLTEANLRRNTVATEINRVKRLVKRYHLQNRLPFLPFLTQRHEELTTQVYNPPAEIEQIRTARLPDTALSRTRDLYVLHCQLGLRFSDFRKILANTKPYVHTLDGRRYLRIRQQKTNDEVVIPLNALAVTILDRHNWRFRKSISSQLYNRQLKEVARLAGLTQPVMVHYTRGGIAISEPIAKYKLMSSHTARRSFATNAFMAGIPSLKIRRITGHKAESSFLRYIRADNMESAESLADHPFFR